MTGTKSFATLTPTLLARKGGAKPAMRPQLQPLQEFHEATARDMAGELVLADDLGWNDMGVEPTVDQTRSEDCESVAEVVSMMSLSPVADEVLSVPEVLHRQASLADRLSASRRPRRSALSQGRRTAFTLRLDPERHLKLRLASTVLSRSAQDIVTEALDNHLATLAEIESLAAKVRKGR